MEPERDHSGLAQRLTPFALCLAGLLAVVVGLAQGGGQDAVRDNALSLPRGLALQEGGAEAAAALDVRYAAKRWPAAYGTGQIDRELAKAAAYGVQLFVGWCVDNEGPVDCTPADWPRVCWGAESSATCGPNYADPATQQRILASIRSLGRYDGHPQVAAVLATAGLDGERRFCKHPFPGDPCYEAYIAAGLTRDVWAKYIRDVVQAYAETFQRTPVLWQYSGFGFHASEVGRDAQVGVDNGLGLLSSGLYPAQCSGNSWGGVCNPLTPLLNDWQVPSVYPGVPFAAEQSLPYSPDQAAMAWLWAVTHGAWQIHAQRQTLAWSAGTEWRETVEYMLAHPDAALWVAWEPTPSRCAQLGRPYYCPEVGNWSRNVLTATYGALGLDRNTAYYGWAARKGPITLTTKVQGPCQVVVRYADGSRQTWEQASGTEIHVGKEEYVHRIEVRPLPELTRTPLPSYTSTATRTPTPTYTATPTWTPSPTWMPTLTTTPLPTPQPQGWRIQGKVGPFRVDLEIRPIGR